MLKLINPLHLMFVAQYRQFDTIIFPEAKDKSSIVVRGFKKGWAWLTGSASPGTGHPEFNVPDVLHIRNECLNFYLQSAKDVILNGSYPEYFEIKEITEKCYVLFHSCYLQRTEHRGSSHDWIMYSVRNVSHELCCYIFLLYCILLYLNTIHFYRQCILG